MKVVQDIRICECPMNIFVMQESIIANVIDYKYDGNINITCERHVYHSLIIDLYDLAFILFR